MKTRSLAVMVVGVLLTLVGCGEVARTGNRVLYGIDTRPVAQAPCGVHP